MIQLVKKDLKLFTGNKQVMLITFVLPIIFITLFASVFGKMNSSEEGNLIGLVQSVAGTSVMMLLFSVAGIGSSLLDEKEEGMLKKLLCSPIPPNHILFAKLIFANIISVFQVCFFMAGFWIGYYASYPFTYPYDYFYIICLFWFWDSTIVICQIAPTSTGPFHYNCACNELCRWKHDSYICDAGNYAKNCCCYS